MSSYRSFIFFLIIFLCLSSQAFHIEWKNLSEDTASNTVTLQCVYDTKDYVMVESMQAAFLPGKENTTIIFGEQPHELFTPTFSRPLLVLNGNGTINFVGVDLKEPVEGLKLSYTLYDAARKKEGIKTTITVSPFEEESSFDLKKQEKIIEESNIEEENIEEDQEEIVGNVSSLSYDQKSSDEKIKKASSFSSTLEKMMQAANNPFVVGLLVFILGIIMSLTPCIYPMIPITLGIVKGNAGDSKSQTIVRASCYVLGIATTFAILGLLAASGTMAFGSLLGKKWFLLLLVIGLGYLTGGMIGFFEIKMPQMPSFFIKSTGYLSLFFFGMISGTVTSPCVSPGLLTLLALVAKSGNNFHGFFYLFLFGLGVGTPLWLVATLFNSFALLPKSGAWMMEIKRIIGLLMLVVLFSYLKILLPLYIAYGIIAGILFATGILFSSSITQFDSVQAIWYKKFMNIICYMLAAALFFSAYYMASLYEKNEHAFVIHTSFEQAQENALQENKKLLIDFTASWCTSCKKLDRACISNENVWKLVDPYVIGLKIDCTNTEDEQIKNLMSAFDVKGLPTVLIVEPVNNKVIAQFGGELGSYSVDECAAQIIEALL